MRCLFTTTMAIHELGSPWMLLIPLSSDSPGKLHVLGHYGDSLCMDSAQVGVLKQPNKVSLRCLLEAQHGSGLEAEISLVFLCNLANKTLERKFSNEEVRGLLVATDLPEGNGSRAVPVRFLHSSSCRRFFPGSLGGEFLSGSFTAGALSSCLFCPTQSIQECERPPSFAPFHLPRRPYTHLAIV